MSSREAFSRRDAKAGKDLFLEMEGMHVTVLAVTICSELSLHHTDSRGICWRTLYGRRKLSTI